MAFFKGTQIMDAIMIAVNRIVRHQMKHSLASTKVKIGHQLKFYQHSQIELPYSILISSSIKNVSSS